jgi:DNA/RNA endonuclease YhcR with UshA esterase domain
LEWNNEYPPSDFERRRNERIYQIQQNRNPFIDHPEFANYIWNNQSPSGVLPDNFSMIPDKPSPGEAVQISFSLSSNSEIPDEVNLFWGDAYDSEDNQTAMAANQSVYSADINMPAYQSGEMVYFKVELIEDTTKTVYRASYLLPTPKDELTFTSIKDVQGDGVQTPVKGQVVTVTGRVSSNFDGSFYIQNGSDIRQGICIYGSLQTGKVGDSIVVTGKATEYSNLTEISDVTYLYNFQDNEEITPIEIPITDINEDYEGMLVKIKGIEFEDQGTTIPNSNTSYTFSNSSGSSVVFSKSNSRLVGNKIPTGKVDLVGVVGQYQDTYQILPRDMDDFMLGSGNSILLKAKKDVDIFPNPSSTIININTGWDVEKIVVYDLSGRVMFSNRTGRKTIGVENIQPGIYILEVTLQGGEIIRKKFIRSE